MLLPFREGQSSRFESLLRILRTLQKMICHHPFKQADAQPLATAKMRARALNPWAFSLPSGTSFDYSKCPCQWIQTQRMPGQRPAVFKPGSMLSQARASLANKQHRQPLENKHCHSNCAESSHPVLPLNLSRSQFLIFRPKIFPQSFLPSGSNFTVTMPTYLSVYLSIFRLRLLSQPTLACPSDNSIKIQKYRSKRVKIDLCTSFAKEKTFYSLFQKVKNRT